MEDSDIRAMINYPDTALVAFAVDQANLSPEEWQIVRMTERDGDTNQSAADKLFLTLDQLKRRKHSGMQKLRGCWGSRDWVQSVIHCDIPQ